MRRSLQNNEGFTLLEVLLSMALAATIGMAAYTMYDNVLDATAHAQKELRGKEEPRAFMRIFMEDLQRIYTGEEKSVLDFTMRPPKGSTIDKEPFLVFATTNRITPSETLYSGLVNVDYKLKGNRPPYTVERRERDYSGISADFPVRSYSLMRGVKELKIYFWDEATNRYIEVNQASSSKNYPSQLKLEFTTSREKKELIVSLPPKEVR